MEDSKLRELILKYQAEQRDYEVIMKEIVDEYGSIDVLFIDGEHTYEGMLQDFRDYSPLVRSVGFVYKE